MLAWRASRVINFAHGAMAMYVTYVFVELRVTGDLILPVVGIPSRVHLASRVAFIPALGIALAVAGLLGLAVHLLIVRPLARAGPLARVVASVGLMVALQAVVTLNVGTTSRPIAAILPATPVRLFGLVVPRDRFYLAAVVVVAAAGLTAVFRFTRFGLASRAAAEDETATALLGWSPSRLAASTWIIGSLLAGLGGILVAPITGLNPVTYSLLVVPALAAALVGGLSSFAVTAAAALALGMAQAELTNLQTRFGWVPHVGLQQGLPLLVILVLASTGRGAARPARATGWLPASGLPAVARMANPWRWAGVLVVVTAAALALTSSGYRLALMTSMSAAIICLSLVLLTGYAGQISLAQMALAGVAGFTLARLTTQAHVPFPVAPLLAAASAGLVGLILGIPARRARGLTLAVVTLAGAVAVEELVFNNAAITGGLAGRGVSSPTLFGLRLGIDGAGPHGYPSVRFGLLCAAVLAVIAGLVAALPGGRQGRRWLAVRADETSAGVAGIDVQAARLWAFVASAAIAGLAGSLIGYQQGRLSPASFDVFVSLGFLALAYLGGIGSAPGALVGGLLAAGGLGWTWLDRVAGLGRYQLLASGVGVVVAVVVFPEGLAGAVARRWRRWRSDRSPGRPPVGEDGQAVADAGWPAVLMPDSPGTLRVEGVTVRFGEVAALGDVSLSVSGGQVTGVIGPNGAGKTTLLDVIAGTIEPDEGSLWLGEVAVHAVAVHDRVTLGLGRTFQTLQLFEDLTVAENVLVAAEAAVAASSTPAAAARADASLALTGLSGDGLRLPRELSTAARRRLAIARVLAAAPRIVVLDEPAAGLDHDERRWLAGLLRRWAEQAGAGVLLVDHDTGLVFDVCDRVAVLDLGRVIAEGHPAAIRRHPDVVAAYLGSAGDPSAASAGAAPQARRARPTGGPLLLAEGLTAGWNEGDVVRGIGLRVEAGELVALVGPNGAGKTTTLLALSSVIPSSGHVELLGGPLASTARLAGRGLGHVPQGRGVLAGLTVNENLRLAGRHLPRDRRVELTGQLRDRFPVLAGLGARPSHLLSGGEQQILAVARALLCDPRLLLVDELSLGLAPEVARQLLGHLRELADRWGIGVLLVEQRTDAALALADRAYVMAAGRIVDEAGGSELLRDPERIRAAYL